MMDGCANVYQIHLNNVMGGMDTGLIQRVQNYKDMPLFFFYLGFQTGGFVQSFDKKMSRLFKATPNILVINTVHNFHDFDLALLATSKLIKEKQMEVTVLKPF